GRCGPGADAEAVAVGVVERLGVEIGAGAGAVTARRAPGAPLSPVRISATDFPDAVPALAALTALAEGESRFEGIGHLRIKESDRIEALAALLTDAGASAKARDNCLVVVGPAPALGRAPRPLRTSHDPRLATARAPP